MKNYKNIMLIACALIFVIILTGCGTIESGYTGVKIVDGIIQDQPIPEGRYGSLGARTSIIKVNNKRQSTTYSDAISGESDDQTVVYAKGVNITYQISKDASIWMVKNMGDDFQECILPPTKIASSVKNAMANIPTENCTNRSYIEPAAKQEIQAAADEYFYPGAVIIIDVSIEQMDYENSYNEQIAKISALRKQAEADAISNQMTIDAAKAAAQAETTRAEAEKKTAEATAEVNMIKARSEAEIAEIEANSYAKTKKIMAEADADRIKMISAAITKEYNEYAKTERWNGSPSSNIVYGADGTVKNEFVFN